MASGVDLPEDGFEEVVVRGNQNRAKDQFNFLPEPTTPEDQVETSATSWSRRIARGAFAQFIREFFDGDFKDRLKSLAPGTAVNFTTFSGDTLEGDQDKRFLQLARKMSQLFQKLPCILITDTGETVNPPGLGYYDRQKKVNIPGEGDQMIRTRSRVFQVPLDIIVASRDEDSADELAEVIGIIIENRNVVGSLLNGENWEVRLPTIWSPGARSTQPIGDDPTVTFALISISAEVGVEVWWYEKTKAVYNITTQGCTINRLRTPRRFLYKPKMALNEKVTLRLIGYPPGLVVFSRDANIVAVTEKLEVIPIHLGKTKLVVRTPRDEILDEFPIEITL